MEREVNRKFGLRLDVNFGKRLMGFEEFDRRMLVRLGFCLKGVILISSEMIDHQVIDGRGSGSWVLIKDCIFVLNCAFFFLIFLSCQNFLNLCK